MVKAKEYYGDVFEKGDNTTIVECRSCNKTFPIGDMLLDIPDEAEYDEDDIVERCPYCKSDFIF